MAKRPIDRELFGRLSPLNGLKPENQVELSKKFGIEDLPAGRFLFKKGDTDKRTLYVISGEVELRNDDKVVKVIKGGSPEAKHLQNPAFHKIPPANIQAMFMRMQPVTLKAGESVIKQGEDGDYFYVLTKGRAVVTRETPLNKQGIKLAELAVGDSFGEEALISSAKRNATITMKTDGTLMKLGKDDFQKLLNEPMLKWVDRAQADKVIAEGGVWLDVRLPSEFENDHPDGAVNIPLYFIRVKLDKLDADKKYVVVCDTGRRSSAASFILNEKGITAFVLQGGLTASAAA
ncbi:MAG: cyclic nucleotide-binding domain-containing protein [Xanthomonadaceae bacterium]|nr:cyclic nucleotide-binding domain-containing protein [Xanthomonadaceae bacterium]